jgi:hypothetical protein
MTAADWVASGIAGLALLASIYSVYRQRASSKPNWGFDFTRQIGQYPGSEIWRAEVRQLGPGESERVSIYSRVKDQPGCVWECWVPQPPPDGAEPMPTPRPVMHSEGFADWDYGRVMRRGEYAWKEAKVTNNGTPYSVQVRVEWVQSPNTHRQRSHVETHEFGPSERRA